MNGYTVQKTGGQPSELLAGVADYIIWYCKDKDKVNSRMLYREKEQGVGEGSDGRYTLQDEDGRFYRWTSLTSSRPPGSFPVVFKGKTYVPKGTFWKTGEERFNKLIAANRIESTGKMINYKRYLDDFPAYPITSIWTDVAGSPDKVYVVQTSPPIIQRCLLMTTDPGDLVLDPTCGPGTTAYVAEQWGRRWITIDTSRVALTLARTRLMAARFPYYLLADSPEGRKKEAELIGDSSLALRAGEQFERDIRKGFVYKRVPHVTLKSIANNPDIKEGMTREQIDAAIRKHAETETLYDQPYPDNDIIRVTGPFTVESLSPHRVLPAGDDAPNGRETAAP